MDTATAFQVVAHDGNRVPFTPQDSAGRWNSGGRRVIYASCTASTALLEFLAHLESALPESLACARVALRDTEVEALDRLPEAWRERPYRADVQQVGDAWLAAGRSLALRVPSALAPASYNLLINPDHPDFARCAVEFTEAFRLDRRLA